MSETIDFRGLREDMVETQLSRRGIVDRQVLDAMGRVPREAFVDAGDEVRAYDDSALPIGHGQTISQPYVVALMIQAAAMRPGDRALEIGSGSGYAAAVMAEIAARVDTVERHAPLGEAARRRLAEAGYDNVEVHVADGTRGWPEGAPFDAIVVAAGAPSAPETLKRQLARHGRLIVPVGAVGATAVQSLLRITRIGPDRWDEERLAAVRFVPLIGDQGWTEEGRLTDRTGATLPQAIAAAAEPLPDPDAPDFAFPFERYADRRLVLLGESTHGTSEFYRARAAITRRLIEEHGFRFVAVEADWPDAAAVNRHVANRPPRQDAEPPFARFPRWMWRNAEVEAFVRWLRGRNADAARPAGFFGLDIYNMRGSIAAVLNYLDAVDPEAADIARERYGCLASWRNDPAVYGRTLLTQGYRDCEAPVVAQLRDLLERRLRYEARDGDAFFDAAQNARLVRAAERYYRVMYYGGAESWNLRDAHMFETLEHLLKARGPEAKAVVWAHNSHIGDARATEMGAAQEKLNLGQLCRERWGDQVALIGFGTHAGTVAAADEWGGEVEVKRIRPSLNGSVERLCHETDTPRFLLDLRDGCHVRERLAEQRPERFIGVIYRPEAERISHYASAALSGQFDAWVWFDETAAITPLDAMRPPACGAGPLGA